MGKEELWKTTWCTFQAGARKQWWPEKNQQFDAASLTWIDMGSPLQQRFHRLKKKQHLTNGAASRCRKLQVSAEIEKYCLLSRRVRWRKEFISTAIIVMENFLAWLKSTVLKALYLHLLNEKHVRCGLRARARQAKALFQTALLHANGRSGAREERARPNQIISAAWITMHERVVCCK